MMGLRPTRPFEPWSMGIISGLHKLKQQSP
uniref:Uncharacterized protein n=1 Tax=Rhizophora mucronata TaxID=61149 RepID=A0A2P2R1F9_RHIMU